MKLQKIVEKDGKRYAVFWEGEQEPQDIVFHVNLLTGKIKETTEYGTVATCSNHKKHNPTQNLSTKLQRNSTKLQRNFNEK